MMYLMLSSLAFHRKDFVKQDLKHSGTKRFNVIVILDSTGALKFSGSVVRQLIERDIKCKKKYQIFLKQLT